MKKSVLFQVLRAAALVCLIFSLGSPLPAAADSSAQNQFTFAELGMTSPIALTSPVGETSLNFNFPVEWEPEGTVSIHLAFSAFFSSLVASEDAAAITGLVGGNLSLTLNGTLLDTSTLSQSGEQTFDLEFDSALLTAPSRGNSNKLVIRWDGSASCLNNLLSSVTIDPASTISFAYSENKENITLNSFPVPFIVENAVQPVPLSIIVPESASLAEMRAALILSAGIGRLSNGSVSPELITLDQYLLSSRAQPNLIIVATSDKVSDSANKLLGLPASSAAKTGEGSLQFFQMESGRFGLLVSGDEEGILKAAQVVSANQVITAGDNNTMIISAVNPVQAVSGVEDMTLQDLGEGELMFTYANGLTKSFDFYVPAASQVRADSYLSLIISHSQQLDYLRSGFQVKINGYPAASLRLTDTTSNENVFQLVLASNLIHVGRNTIELIADLYTRDLCTEPTETNAWLRVSSNSSLHIPLESVTTGSQAVKTFKDFPDQFLSGSGLDNVLFVLSGTDSSAWQAASQLAWQLGAALPQDIPLQLQVSWSDSLDANLAAQSNLILAGKPSDFSTLTEKGLFPSLVFTSDNLLSNESALTIVTQPETGADTGYIAIRGYSDGSNRVSLAVLGNTTTGINSAVNALGSDAVSETNFAVVVAEDMQSGWVDQGIATGEISQIEPEATALPTESDTSQKYRQDLMIWSIPVIVLLLALLTLMVFAEVKRQKRQ